MITTDPGLAGRRNDSLLMASVVFLPKMTVLVCGFCSDELGDDFVGLVVAQRAERDLNPVLVYAQ